MSKLRFGVHSNSGINTDHMHPFDLLINWQILVALPCDTVEVTRKYLQSGPVLKGVFRSVGGPCEERIQDVCPGCGDTDERTGL